MDLNDYQNNIVDGAGSTELSPAASILSMSGAVGSIGGIVGEMLSAGALTINQNQFSFKIEETWPSVSEEIKKNLAENMRQIALLAYIFGFDLEDMLCVEKSN